jgi:UDP:flavonoid glycosyltransferase YjiC (YdhE family)
MAQAVLEAAADPRLREAARELAEVVRAEDGISRAVALLESMR